MKIEVGYLDVAAEKEILHRYTNGNGAQSQYSVLTPVDVLHLQAESRKVHIDDKIVDYMIEAVNRTRNHPEIDLGISPRGTVALFRASQALALVADRNFVVPDDVKRAIFPVFGHRLILARNSVKGKKGTTEVLEGILEDLTVPV